MPVVAQCRYGADPEADQEVGGGGDEEVLPEEGQGQRALPEQQLQVREVRQD